MVVPGSQLSSNKLKFLERIEILNSEVRDYLRSQHPKPSFLPGFSPLPVQTGLTFYSDSGAFFPGSYGAEVVHSGVSGVVTDIEPGRSDSIAKLVIQESDAAGNLTAEGLSYSYYGIEVNGIRVGERVITGQAIGIAMSFLSEMDSVGVQVQVRKGEKDMTLESFRLNYDTHPVIEAATMASQETDILDLTLYSLVEIAEVARGITQGKFTVIGEVGILPSLQSGASGSEIFKGVQVAGIPECLRNALKVLAQPGDILVSPMRGEVIQTPDEIRNIIDLTVLLENGDVLFLGGINEPPEAGKTIKAGEAIGYVAETDGVVVATFSFQDYQ
jgi:hypothetical protein